MATEPDPQLQLLGRRAEAGLEVTLAIETRAKAAVQDRDIDLNGLSLAYDRVARAVRMTVARQSRLIEELKARRRGRRRARRDGDPQGPRRAGGRVLESERQDDAEIDRLILRAERPPDDEDL